MFINGHIYRHLHIYMCVLAHHLEQFINAYTLLIGFHSFNFTFVWSYFNEPPAS